MGRATRPHLLAGNARESSPSHIMVIDTETRWSQDERGENHRLRLWCGESVLRHGVTPTKPRHMAGYGHDVGELVGFLHSQIRADRPCWLYCHNLGFDLAVTVLPVALADAGWVLGSHNLASDSPWAHLTKGAKSLYLVDSFSLLPHPLVVIGDRLGIAKPKLPENDDSLKAWLIRCAADVRITMSAVVQLMDWWDAHQLGHWSITGPRSAWNMMRHQCTPRRGYKPPTPRGPGTAVWGHQGHGHPVIDPLPEGRAQERTALFQGRREAYRVGELERGLYVEVDMRAAHLSVCRSWPLPSRRGLRFDALPVDNRYLDDPDLGIIARVRLKTDVADYPLRTASGIVYPVGEFVTTLPGPEIMAARAAGHLQEIGPGWWHRLSWHMQPWADRLTAWMGPAAGEHPPAAAMFLKAASRTVPGKWAARTSRVLETGTSPVQGWRAEHGIHAQSGSPVTLMHYAGQLSVILRDQEADDAYPGVFAWITSVVRCNLATAILAVGPHRVITTSTDSLLICADGSHPDDPPWWSHGVSEMTAEAVSEALCAYLGQVTPGITWGVKGWTDRARVMTPQHVVLGGVPRLSGVPRGAAELERDRWRFLTWPRLAGHLAGDDISTYRRESRTVDLSGLTVPRWTYACGCTTPALAQVDDEGTTTLTASRPARCELHDADLLRRQWHGLPTQ